MSEPRRLGRRAFLRGGLGAALGVSAAASESSDPYALVKPPVPGSESWSPYEEKTVTTACGQCSAGCGIRVRVVEGRAVSIAGDPQNPINRGGIGPRGLAGLQTLYDPDRVQQPLRRKGPRLSGDAGGATEWEPISWETALAEISERLLGLRMRKEPERLAILCGRERGMMREFWERFASSYGTPNFFEGSSRGSSAVGMARFLMQGHRDIPAYDWKTARYVLSLGAGILEASCQAISFARGASMLKSGRTLESSGAGFQHRRAGPGRIVQVEPSYSRTAASADSWIQIAPGTHAAFALGIAHILVRDGTYDRNFVETQTSGFEDRRDDRGRIQRGLRSVLPDYAPDRVAAICDVSPDALEQIAADLSSRGPAFVVTDPRATMAPNGLHTAMAVEALNGLLGAVEAPGGTLDQHPAPIAPWPALELDNVARGGLRAPRLDGVGTRRHPLALSVSEELANALLTGRPYDVDTLMLYYANPCYAWLNPDRWRRALERVPFVVTFTPFLDETANEVADLVLPDHTYLERWEDAAPAPSEGAPVFGVRQPVVEPLHDTRATGDFVIELAGALGEPLASAFPWRDFRTAMLRRAVALHDAKGGSIEAPNSKKFLQQLFKDGFWTAPPEPPGPPGFPTPSGKFEFFSSRLRDELESLAFAADETVAERLTSWGYSGSEEFVCLPHYDPIGWSGDEARFPLLLEPFKPGTYAEGSGANLPLLQELVTEPGAKRWGTTASIHPETASAHGIADGDRIVVESAAGRIELPVHLSRGVHRGSVRIPQGGGHTAFGRFARDQGANVMELLVPAFDPIGGFAALHGTRVRMTRAEV